MNKKAAAEFLGIGVRSLERHTADGNVKANKKKNPGSGQKALDYDLSELQRFKATLEGPEVEGTVEEVDDEAGAGANGLLAQASPASPQDSPPGSAGIAASSATTLARLPDPRAVALITAVVGEALNQLEERDQRPAVQDVAVKLLLTLPECQMLTGLSRATLRGAIDDGTLKARQIGRGWKVTRAALESLVTAMDADAPAQASGRRGKR